MVVTLVCPHRTYNHLLPLVMPQSRLPIQPLTIIEQRLIDDVMRQGRGSAIDALRSLNKARRHNHVR